MRRRRAARARAPPPRGVRPRGSSVAGHGARRPARAAARPSRAPSRRAAASPCRLAGQAEPRPHGARGPTRRVAGARPRFGSNLAPTNVNGPPHRPGRRGRGRTAPPAGPSRPATAPAGPALTAAGRPPAATAGGRLQPAQGARLARHEAQREQDRGEDAAHDDHAARARGVGEAAGQQIADRQQHQRAHPVVRAHARERLGRDALGHRRVPPHVEQREAGARGEASGTSSATGAPAPKATSIMGHAAITQKAARIGRRGRQRRPRARRANAPAPNRALHHAEQRHGAVRVLGDRRPEHEQRRVAQRHGEREDGDRHPQPRARAHLGEALGAARPAGSAAPRPRRRLVRAHAGRKTALTTNVAASRAKAQPAPTPSTSTVASAGPASSAMLVDVRQRLRLLDLLRRHRARQQTGVGGAEERLGRAEQRLDHHEMPDLHHVGEDQGGQQPVQRGAHEVGGDHQAGARQPVGPDAADQQERHERERLRAEHEPDVGRAARQVGHEQGERDDDQAVADHAGGLRQPHVAECRAAQDAQAGAAPTRPAAPAAAVRPAGRRVARVGRRERAAPTSSERQA